MRASRVLALVLCLAASVCLAGQAYAQGSAMRTQDVKALLSLMVRAHGGTDKVRSVEALRIKIRYRTQKGAIHHHECLCLPDRLRVEDEMIHYRRTVIVAPDVAVVFSKSHKDLPLSSAYRADFLLQDVGFYPVFLLQHVDDPAFGFTLAGRERIGSTEAVVLDVSGYGAGVRLSVDPRSGRVLRYTWHPTGKTPQTLDFLEWRLVEGRLFPYRWTTRWGEGSSENEVVGIQINPPVAPRLFERKGPPLASLVFNPAAMAAAPIPVATARLEINTTPGNALVHVNDELWGTTSSTGRLTVDGLEAGTHRLRISLAGHKDWSEEVTAEAGETKRVGARLEAVPPPVVTARLEVTTTPGGALVHVNDQFRGASSAEGKLVVEGLSPGAHRLRISLPSYKEWTQEVTLKAGDNQRISARLEPAGPKPLTLSEIEEALSGGIAAARVTNLVSEYGVDFPLTDDAERRLRTAGADDTLLLAIAKGKK